MNSTNMNKTGIIKSKDGKHVHVHKEIVDVRVGDIVSETFQREINPHRVKSIAENFDIHRFDPPSVGRDNGRLVVYDGQHRVAAVKLLFGDDARIDVCIDDLGYQEMAKLFAMQDDNRNNVNTIDKFKARIESEDEKVKQIRDVLGKYGLSVGQGNPLNHIKAAKDIERSFDKLGSIVFDTMINVMQQGFSNSKDIWMSATIKGMTKFFETFIGDDIDVNILIEQLKGLNLENVHKAAREVNPRDTVSGFSFIIAREYNRRKRGRNKLNTSQLTKA